MSILPACMCMHHVHAWCLQRPGQGVRSPGTGVMEGCKKQCGCWELNPDLLSSARATGALNREAIPPTP